MMRFYSAKVFWLLLLGLAAVMIFLWDPSGEKAGPRFKIGIPDGSGGIIFQYIIHEKMPREAVVFQEMGIFSVKDCCTTTAEWALSSGSLSLAVMCPDSARRFVEKDSRYEIMGPCVLNTDILMVRNKYEAGPKKIAVSHGRDFQKTMVKKLLGENGTPVLVITSAIPYAYEKGLVDGAVLDILRGFKLQGEIVPYSIGKNEDLVTYVLVVRKSFKENPLYRKFFSSYREAIGELNRKEVLDRVVRRYGEIEMTEERFKQWKERNVTFTLPSFREGE